MASRKSVQKTHALWDLERFKYSRLKHRECKSALVLRFAAAPNFWEMYKQGFKDSFRSRNSGDCPRFENNLKDIEKEGPSGHRFL